MNEAKNEKCFPILNMTELENGNYVLFDDHIRLKGVSFNCIKHLCKEKYDGIIERVFDNLICAGIESFDLCKGGPKFKSTKDFKVFSLDSFPRDIKFAGDFIII